MTVPLEPESGLFPDTFLAPFVVAPEVEDLATLVIDSCSEFEPIATAKREGGLSIVYVFETRSFDPLKDEFKPHTIAKVTKASPLWRALTTFDLAVQFRLPFWDAFDERQRQAALHEALSHIEVDEPGDERGITKVSLRGHDVEDFNRTVRRFGALLPGRAAFFKAFLDWQHEQERPEPTKLRPLGGEPASESVEQAAEEVRTLVDKAIDNAVAKVNRGALGPGARAWRGGAKDDPEKDIRPTGEVNTDALRGEVERATEDESPA